MAFNYDLYPQEIFTNPTAPYIYFLSLPNEILDKVADEFNRDLSSFSGSKTLKGKSDNTNVIEQAFDFLEAVIQSERGKEEAFLSYLKDKTQTTFEIKLPSINDDWKNFVTEIQSILDYGDNGLQDLYNEFKRLEENKKKFEDVQKNNPNLTSTWGIKDTIKQVSERLQKIMNFFKTDFSPQSDAYKVIKLILMNYKDELLEFDNNNKLILKEHELGLVLQEISTVILHLYVSNPDLFTMKDTPRFDIDIMNNYLTQNKKLDEDIRNMIKNIKQYPKLRSSLASSLHLTPSRAKTLNANPLINGNQLIDNADQLVVQLHKIMKSYSPSKKAIELVSKTSDFAEIESMTKMVVSGAVMAHNTGSKFAKPDNVIGYIAIDPTKLDPKNNPQVSEILSTINQIQNQLAELVRSLDKTNTLEYYQEKSIQWNELAGKINQLLSVLREKNQIFSSCFIIEDSTKNYLSLYAKLDENNELETGPHGGSLGAVLSDQLNKIETLARAGGITMLDKQWLTAAIVNSSNEMIAGKQRKSLEDYLAMFAAILLFDGQINIAKEALLRANFESLETSVHEIHLFSVNNGYYPLSYVLKLTYDHLQKGLGQIEQDTRQGVQAEIFGHIREPIFGDNPIDSWNKTSKAALNSTKIKMRFLVHLQNTISDLLKLQ